MSESLSGSKEEVAYHEAGHAFCAYVMGLTVTSVNIQPVGNDWRGWTKYTAGSDPNTAAKVMVSGDAAVEYFFPSSQNVGRSQSDWKYADAMIRKALDLPGNLDRILWPDADRKKYYNHCEKLKTDAANSVKQKSCAVRAVAKALMTKGTLNTEELKEIIDPLL